MIFLGYRDLGSVLRVTIWGYPCSIMHDRHRVENMALAGGRCPVCAANAKALRWSS